ncbi:MAG: DMT family transporter [Acidimicrobiia bacterium]
MTRITALVGIVTISFSAIFVRFAEVSPTTAAFFRAAYAIPVLIVATRFVTDTRTRRERLLAFAAGGLLAIDLVLWHTAIDYIGAGLATVVANSQVLWVGLLAWVILRERPSAVAFAVVPVVLIGVTLIGGVGSGDAYGENPSLGALLALGAGITYTGFLLLLRSSNKRLAPTPGPLLDATAGAAVGTLLLSPLDSGFSFAFTWPAHGWLLLLGTLIQVFGWLLITKALPRLPALDTSVMLLLQPALTIVWARILFTEALATLQWVGVGLVMAGILTASTRGTVRAVPAAEPGPPVPPLG